MNHSSDGPGIHVELNVISVAGEGKTMYNVVNGKHVEDK